MVPSLKNHSWTSDHLRYLKHEWVVSHIEKKGESDSRKETGLILWDCKEGRKCVGIDKAKAEGRQEVNRDQA